MPPARPWRRPLKHANVRKKRGLRTTENVEEAAEAETIFNDATKNTLEKTEALEKHVKTVTMRAEFLATTEADFFQTLLDRQEETQQNLNALSTQLCQTRSTQ